MKFKSMLAAVAVASLGLTACSPVGNPVETVNAKVSAAKSNVIMGIRAKAGSATAPQVSVTLSKIELVDAAGTIVVVTDTPQTVQLGSLKQTAQQILASASVADGTYVEVRVTITKADGTIVTKNIPVNITVAGGAVTNIVVSADPQSVANAASNGSSSVPDMTADDNSQSSSPVDGVMVKEGTITAIADDKASFSFKMEHSTDVVTVNIVSGAATDNTVILDKAGNTVDAAALAVGDEAYVEGDLDATTNVITAKTITVEHEDASSDGRHGDHDSDFALGADEALIKGSVDVVNTDATSGAITSFTVTLQHAVGALPADATSVTVNVDANTHVVMCGRDYTPSSSNASNTMGSHNKGDAAAAVTLALVQGDDVFVRGTVVIIDGNATNAVNAVLVVVKPLAMESDEVGVVSALDATAMTFTLTKGDGTTVAVSYTDTTEMKRFATDAPLADGQKVKVEGYTTDGVLAAKEIRFIPVTVTSDTTPVDPAANTAMPTV